ncbi:MAG TPA: nucleotidyltransferase [Microscillaceae bacterium]|nr:nucleotidyltransferase [Microscillaceae bacterium]
MARTVNAAFDEFMSETVNLDSKKTTKARNSRDELLKQIKSFSSDPTFPKLQNINPIHFGSFNRRTKIRPLDDIDLMVALSAQGAPHSQNGGIIKITIDNDSNLGPYCHDRTNQLSSIKIVNKFVKKLSKIHQYQQAQIKRNQEAATLKLKSYEWNFDIVPFFTTRPYKNGRDYYLIPNGKGHWKITDPRIDKTRVERINQLHNGYVLQVIRAIKYWNKHARMPTINSYLLENMILNYYEKQKYLANQYVDVEIIKVLEFIQQGVYQEVNDPKSIQGNLNTLDIEEKSKISKKAREDRILAVTARQYEYYKKDYESSIKKWGEIFGNEFPSFS